MRLKAKVRRRTVKALAIAMSLVLVFSGLPLSSILGNGGFSVALAATKEASDDGTQQQTNSTSDVAEGKQTDGTGDDVDAAASDASNVATDSTTKTDTDASVSGADDVAADSSGEAGAETTEPSREEIALETEEESAAIADLAAVSQMTLLTLGGNGSTEIKAVSTCKIYRDNGTPADASDDTTVYYATLADAIEGAEDGDTIQIFKSHSVYVDMNTSGKSLTIMNIIDPASDAENPEKNGSFNVKPVVSFETGGRLLVNSDVTMRGVVLDGKSKSRTSSAVSVAAGCNFSIYDGEAGGALEPTSSVVRDFKNNNAAADDSSRGGFVTAAGTVCVFGATISGCHAASDGWNGGGAVAYVSSTGKFEVAVSSGDNVTITGNGDMTGGGTTVAGNATGAIYVNGGSFTMAAGTAQGNVGNCGGFVFSSDEASASGSSIVMTGGTIAGNSSAADGGAIRAGKGTAVEISNAEVTANTAGGSGGAVSLGDASSLVLGGSAKVNANTATGDGGAVCMLVSTTSVTLLGSVEVTDNTGGGASGAGAAIEGAGYAVEGTMSVSGCPKVDANTGKDGIEANLNVGSAAHLLVGDLAEGGNVGIYSTAGLTDEGTQFATAASGTASDMAYLGNTFINDATSKLVAIAGDGAAIKWYTPVCKISRVGTSLYYGDLAAAIAAAQDGETVEILRSHTVNVAMDTPAGKNLTIMNVNEPVNDAEDYTKNGNNVTPVVTFGTTARLNVKGTVTLKGVVLEGSSSVRTQSAVRVESGCTLHIYDGENATLDATAFEARNFVNQTQSGTTVVGGFANVSGTAYLHSGTISGCQAWGSTTNTGGGACFNLNSNGAMYMEGGLLTKCGTYDENNYNYLNTPVVVEVATFEMTGGKISDNTCSHGGALNACNAAAVVNIKGGEISNNSVYWDGGAIFFVGGSSCTVSGGTFSDNFARRAGSAFSVRANCTLNIEGSPRITGNTSVGTTESGGNGNIGGAIESLSGTNEGTVTVKGSPYIYGNGRVAAKGNTALTVAADISLHDAAKLKVSGDLGTDAKIGYYSSTASLVTLGNQFATAYTTAKDVKNIAGSFVCNNNTSYVSAAGADTKVVWAEAVCKITRADNIYYFNSLATAIAGANSGETIEILKSHTVNVAMSTAGKVLTIKNVTAPVNDSERPSENGSADEQPVVTFGTAGQLQVGSNVTLMGMSFNGASSARATPPITIAAGYTLTVSEYTATAADTLEATPTTFKNFVNNSTANATAGGLFYVNGTVNMSGGTISGCKANGAQWAGGGAVATINSGAVFNMTGGTVTGNGQYRSAAIYNDGPFVLNAGTFYMSGGKITGNNSTTGGAVGCKSDGQTSGNCTVTIEGDAEISNNRALLDGGAIFAGNTTTCNIGGNARIVNNFAAGASGAIHIRSSSKLYISGSPTITGNTSTATRGLTGLVGAAIEGLSYNNEGTVYVSGSPTITGNGKVVNEGSAIATTANVNLSAASKLLVSDLDAGGKIGYYNDNTLCNQNMQFATSNGKNASQISNLTSTFANDRNSDYLAMASTNSSTPTAIIWGIAVCKRVTATGAEVHYGSLADAITAAATGERIEIYKSHTVNTSMDTTGKNLTIMNVVEPASDVEDYTKNGNNVTPVVTFGANARLLVNSTIALKGVQFDGGATDRTTSGMLVSAGYTLNIYDGETGTLPKTDTVLKRFRNTTATLADCGGLMRVNGTVNMEGGTLKQNYTAGTTSSTKEDGSAYCQSVGGMVAFVPTGGTFNFKGGYIANNETGTTSGCWGQSAITVYGGTFNMTGGEAYGNTAWTGGLVHSGKSGSGTIHIEGGKIHDNEAFHQGGAVYIYYAGTNTTIDGTAEIYGNKSGNGGSAVEMRCANDSGGNITVKVGGNAKIYKNTNGSKRDAKANKADGCTNGAFGSWGYQPNYSYGIVEISGSPYIWDNYDSAGQRADVVMSYGAVQLKVTGDLGNATVGYYNNYGLCNAGTTFGNTSAADSSTVSNVTGAFINDKDTSLLSVPISGSTGIKWATANVKVVTKIALSETDSTTGESMRTYTTQAHPFQTIGEAAAFVKTLATSETVDGQASSTLVGDDDPRFRIEVLVAELSQTEQVTFATDTTRPLLLTTADSNATDGLPYRGTAGNAAVVKRAFAGSTTFPLSSGMDLALENVVLDGNKGTYTVQVAGTDLGGMFELSDATVLTMNDGAKICNTAAYKASGVGALGGAVHLCGGAKFVMNAGSIIDGCSANWGGAVYAEPTGYLFVNGATLTNNEAAMCGGALACYGNATMEITGTEDNPTIISGNKATGLSAIRICNGSSLDISGFVNITGNSNLAGTNDTEAAAVGSNATYKGSTQNDTMLISGTPYIYDNTDSTGTKQQNLLDHTSLDEGAFIRVGEAGLADRSKIGVTALESYNAGNTFARTVAASASSVSNLSAFVNDKSSRLTGLAGAGNATIWSSIEPLILKATIPVAKDYDEWVVVQLVDGDTGNVYRQAVKVPAGSTEGSATVAVSSGVTYTVADVSEQSSWRFSTETTSYDYDSGATTTDVWTTDTTGATIGTIKILPSDNDEHVRTLTLAQVEDNASWESDGASVINTVTIPS